MGNTPNVRFKGFTEDWEQRKVDKVMSCITDYVAAGSFADIRNNVTYLEQDGYAQLVRTVDLKNKFNNHDFVYVGENAFEYLWRVNLNEECIVLPNIGANIGEVYYIKPLDLPEEHNVLGPNAILLKTKEDNYFVFTALNTDRFQSQLFENVGSSGQPKFNKTELKTINLMIPQYEEQKKIGDYFRNLDHLITLHQQKCDETKEFKKYMLQNMFPQKDEKVPKIRFDGFTGDWEQRKVSEITTSYSGGTPKAGTAEYYDGEIPFIRSGEIYSDTTELSITEAGLKNSSAKMVHIGDILYALYGATSGEVNRARLEGAINQAILAIIPNTNINADFLVEWFRKEKNTITDKYLQGGQGNLSAQIIKGLEVSIPSQEEQNKIGEYFSQINHLITLHQQKCNALKELKKYMLQNMFPQKGENKCQN